MTAAERETLKQLAESGDSDHGDGCVLRKDAAAIRAAIAEVDRLRADLTGVMGEVQRIQPEGSPPPFGLPFHAKWCVDAMIALVDALTKRALDAEMGLSIFRDDCAAVSAALARLPLAPGATDAGIGWYYRISELLAEVDRLRAENADLRGRAIPEALIERYEIEVECYRDKRLALRIDCRTREVVRWVDGSTDAQVTAHPTLAAALEAAGG